MATWNGSNGSNLDLVIVGAGAAGLSAAMEARRRALSFIVLEAKSRIGGRTYTESMSLGVPFDHGAYWMHSADENPYAQVADALGFVYRKERRPRQVYMGERWATEEELREREAFFDRSMEAIKTVGESGRDVPFSDVLEDDIRWRPQLDQWIAAVNGVDPDEASTLDHWNYRDTGENWPVRDGYGALIAEQAKDIPVETDTPVERIDWGRTRVRVVTPRGELSAKGVILTVSTGVLASGVIRFNPPLPEWKLSAIDAVPMGKANKVAFRFRPGVLNVPEDSSVTFYESTFKTLGFQLQHFGRDVASGYVGGRFSSELEAAGPDAMMEFSMERIRAIFGSNIEREVIGSACTAWETDPYIRGGYSAARPGQAKRRVDLALPVEDHLFFAGEATSPQFFSTAHGAYLSGIEAVRQAADALGWLTAAGPQKEAG